MVRIRTVLRIGEWEVGGKGRAKRDGDEVRMRVSFVAAISR
jgi:hypothetical protein